MIVERFPPVYRVRYISLDIQMIHLNFSCNHLRVDFKIFQEVNYISRVSQGFFQGQFLFQGLPGFPGLVGHPVRERKAPNLEFWTIFQLLLDYSHIIFVSLSLK